jgi:ferredoxin-NADP reductase
MTSITLLQWILGALLLQVAALMALAFVRHWQAYSALRTAAIKGGVALPSPAEAAPADAAPADADVPAWAGFRPFRVRAKTLEDAAGQVCSFELVPDDGASLPPFLPGQFLTFRLELPAAQGNTAAVVRCYSLSDAPSADAYRVTIKRAPAPVQAASRLAAATGAVSHFFHDQVSVGSLLQVRAPAGRFFLDRGQAPVVLIAGGIGITPMLSIVNWAMQEQPKREVWLFYGVREAAEGVMLPQLQALAAKHPNFHLHLCFSGPPPTAEPREPRERATLVHQHHSRIDVRLLRSVLPLKPYHFYLCGPTALLVSLVPALEGWGVVDERIHFEAFGPASIPRRKAALRPPGLAADSPVAGPLAVTFASSGKTCTWRPGLSSLLDLAEANGIDVASGCRSGSCGSCQTTIRAGQVRYAHAPDHTPEPGTCLLCVSTPASAVTLDA